VETIHNKAIELDSKAESRGKWLMAYDEKEIYDEFWKEIKAQADKKLFSLVDEEDVRKIRRQIRQIRQITITPRRPKSTSARTKRVDVMRSRNAIEIRGDIDPLDLEFVRVEGNDIVGFKYRRELLNPSQAAEKLLELLSRVARET
jgi:hypothetical protein